MDELLEALSNKSNRNAAFQNGSTLNIKETNIFTIAEPNTISGGSEGFGYDPIFQPEGYETFAGTIV
jgi:XTP/dITP diphosphohydrolase